MVSRLVKSFWRILTHPLLALGYHPHPHPLQSSGRPRSRLRRAAIGLCRRVLLAPIMLLGIMVMLLFGTTQRIGVLAAKPPAWNPASINLFYRDVTLRSADGVELSAWYVPAWSANRFAAADGQALRTRRPGLVLCHGAWADRSQLLHLLPALHAAGYELLLLEMRGCGQSGGQIGLGLTEWQDVAAAVGWMQRVGSVDPQRIGLIGCDVNATSVLRAAAGNPAVRVVVLDRPCRTVGTYLQRRFEHINLPGRVFGRLYEWTFALSRAASMNEASTQHWVGKLSAGQALFIAARQPDPLTPGGDPYAVLSNARCPKTIKIRMCGPDDEPGQSAIMPNDLLAFLRSRLPTEKQILAAEPPETRAK